MPNYTYKLGRSAGVLALRPVNPIAAFPVEQVVRQDFVGVATDDADVWKTTFIGGASVLSDALTLGLDQFYPATRINHPEEGPIWYADEAKPSVYVNGINIRYAEVLTGVSVYIGENGEIDGQNNALRYFLADGSTIVVAEPA
jgi:hypothetical protein